jgi:hypothetical protein
MARTSTYLNFPRSTEAAFINQCRHRIFRAYCFKDIPPQPGVPLAGSTRWAVAFPFWAGMLMGTDAPGMGFTVKQGNTT